MKIVSRVIFTFLLGFASIASAQFRASIGVSAGLQVHPERIGFPLVSGVSSWVLVHPSLHLSAEILSFKGCEYYPSPPAGYGSGPFEENSRTTRLSLGVHYPMLRHNSSVMSLLGMNLGLSRDRCSYGIHKLAPDDHSGDAIVTDEAYRMVVFFSWTALGTSYRVPVFLQIRYGFSYSGTLFSSIRETQTFAQIVAGVHWGIL